MSRWIQWSLPAVALAATPPAVHAAQYLTIAEAQQLAFPSAQFVRQGGRAFKVQQGGRTIGLFVLDHVVGKHLYIDYAVSIGPGGVIRRVDILQYRESYGGDVRGSDWLSQFAGKTAADPIAVGSDIRNISGATLSSHHVAEGVKRIVSIYGSRL